MYLLKTKPPAGTPLNFAHPLCNGLVCYYVFNEYVGGSVIDVTKRQPRNGLLTNFALSGNTSNWVGTRDGGGLYFDGTNDFITFPLDVYRRYLDYNKPFTFSFWTKLSSYSTTQNLTGCENINVTSLSTYDDCSIYLTSSKLNFQFIANVSSNSWDGRNWIQTSAPGFVAGNWYHMVVAYNGQNTASSVAMYINGVNTPLTVDAEYGDITRSVWATYPATYEPYIGARSYSGGPNYTTGIIDNLRIYNRMLGPAEIGLLYNDPFAGFMNTRKYYINPTLYGIGAWGGKLTAAGASGTLAATSANKTVEAYMALSFKKQ